MKCLVTGGAGFIGRAVVKRLLQEGNLVAAVDDLSNGREANLAEFAGNERFLGLIRADVADPRSIAELFERETWDAIFHLAASIHVQRSIDEPRTTFRNDVQGTFELLEACKGQYFRLNGFEAPPERFDFDALTPRLIDRRPRVVAGVPSVVQKLVTPSISTYDATTRPSTTSTAGMLFGPKSFSRVVVTPSVFMNRADGLERSYRMK